MYIRMNVGAYKGEIRGPFHVGTARSLIARGDASPTESLGDGRYRVIETVKPEPMEEAAVAPAEVAAEPAAVEVVATAKTEPQQQHRGRRR